MGVSKRAGSYDQSARSGVPIFLCPSLRIGPSSSSDGPREPSREVVFDVIVVHETAKVHPVNEIRVVSSFQGVLGRSQPLRVRSQSSFGPRLRSGNVTVDPSLPSVQIVDDVVVVVSLVVVEVAVVRRPGSHPMAASNKVRFLELELARNE